MFPCSPEPTPTLSEPDDDAKPLLIVRKEWVSSGPKFRGRGRSNQSKPRSPSVRLQVGNRNTLATTASSSSSSASVSSYPSDRVALACARYPHRRNPHSFFWYCSQSGYEKETTTVRGFVEQWISDNLPEFSRLGRKLVYWVAGGFGCDDRRGIKPDGPCFGRVGRVRIIVLSRNCFHVHVGCDWISFQLKVLEDGMCILGHILIGGRSSCTIAI